MKKIHILSQDRLDSIIKAQVDRAVDRSNNSLERELLLKQANLAALQEQINPHFLYNALECIRGLAIIENADKVEKATLALSQYFRYCISNRKSVVTLRDELEYVLSYVTIQQFRFQGRFTVENLICDEDVLDVVVPKLMLQPIIENAILHGLADKMEDGHISLSAVCTLSNMEIHVKDNGIGMSADALRRLNESINKSLSKDLERPESGRGNGMALNNVNSRLKMMFGEVYGLTVYSSGIGLGTSVVVYLPLTYLVNEQ